MRLLLLGLIIILNLHAAPVVASESNLVRVCGDNDPLGIAATSNTLSVKNKQSEPLGFSVDMIRAVFALLGKKVQFAGDLPWKRCLIEVESGNIDFAMDAYFDLERAKKFDYSSHYNTLTPQIFFLKSNPIDHPTLAKLKGLRGCGVLGTSYAHYGVQSKDLDLGATRETLIKKLLARRCDYFLEELEDMASYKLVGVDYLADPMLQYQPASWAVAPSKFLITAKNSRNTALLDQINSAIYSVIRSGQAEKFWQKTSTGLPYKP
ncbi:polar amino acid transport system substrate-binding protein [Oxalobacteraceae bacterium GrIS 2.11]